MTPEPEPEPTEPKYTVTMSNTLNNSYMFRIVYFDNATNLWTPITGGVSSIITPGVYKFDIPSTGMQDRFRITFKAYNNQYTDWSDSYYDTSDTCMMIVDGATAASFPASTYTTYEVTFLGSSAPQIRIDSES